MRLYKFFFLVINLLVFHTGFSQISLMEPKFPTDSTRVGDRVILDFTFDGWQKTPLGVTYKFGGPGFSVSSMVDFQIGKSVFSFSTGGVISSHNVFSNGEIVYDTLSNYSTLTPFSSNYKFRKNKLSMTYIGVPIELRMISRGEQRWRIVLGFKAGYLLNMHSKTLDNTGRYKWYNYKNTLKYRYGVYARLGYKKWSLYGYYGLTTIFKKDRGSELAPVSLGISISLL